MRAPDGTEFTDRAAYRKHLFLTQFTFKDREGEILRKLPGDIDGQPFDLTALRRCEVALLDHSEAVQVDELIDCRVFIAACVDSVFVRDCTGCVFTVACKQLRTRDCKDCEFRLYCKTEPIIETSHGMSFAPFNGAYVGHAEHLRAARLTTPNLWFGVYDFNDEARTGKNWRLLDEKERGDEPWRPLNDNSEVAVPLTLPGSVPLPSKRTGTGGGGGGTGGGVGGGRLATMAFSFSTSAAEAEAVVNAQTTNAGPASGPARRGSVSGADTAAAPPAAKGGHLLREGAASYAPPLSSTSSTSSCTVKGTPAGGSVFPGAGGRGGAKIGWDPSRDGNTVIPAGIGINDRTKNQSSGRGSGGRARVGCDPSRLGCATTAGRPAAAAAAVAGEGGGGTALPSPQQQAEGAEINGAVEWGGVGGGGGGGGGARGGVERRLSSESATVADVEGPTTAALVAAAAAVGPRVQTLTPSGVERGGCGQEDEGSGLSPLLLSTQPQPRPRIGWDPSRASSTTTVTTAKAASPSSCSTLSQPYTATCAPAALAAPTAAAADSTTAAAQKRAQEDTRTAWAGAGAGAGTKPRVGWSASRVGNAAVPAPLMGVGAAAAAMPCTAAGMREGAETKPKAKAKIGWNASRVGDPAVPAPVMNFSAATVPTAAEAAAAVANAVTAAVAVARRDVAGSGTVGEAAAAAARVRRREEVPLQLRAVLLYACTQRGLDLRKWFDVGRGGGGEEEEGEGEEEEEAVNVVPTLLTMVQFELVLVGLAEGLKAGLSEEERREIDAALAPEIIVAAAAAAAMPAARSEEDAAETGGSSTGNGTIIGNGHGSSSSSTTNRYGMVDVSKLLDLCGIPRSESSPSSPPLLPPLLPPPPPPPLPPPPPSPPPVHSERGCAGAGAGRTCHEKEGGTVVGGAARGGGGGDRKGKGAAAAAATADENTLRRVMHQADLYGRLLTSLGLKQPIGCSSQGAYSDWEVSLRLSTVPLGKFRHALGEVGLQLSRTRALALATRACGPLGVVTDVPVTSAGHRGTRRRRGRGGGKNQGRPASAASGSGVVGTNPHIGGRGSKSGGGSRSGGSNSGGGGGGGSIRENNNNSSSRGSKSPQHRQRQRQQHRQQHDTKPRQQQQPHGVEHSASGGSGRSRRSASAPPRPPQSGQQSPPPAPAPPAPSQLELQIPAWDLRRYLLRLRCEPKSSEARCDQQQRRKRRYLFLAGRERESEMEGRKGMSGGGGGDGDGDGDGDGCAAALSGFAAWGKRIREEHAERERERERQFQSALAGRPHTLSLDQLLECVCRFEIMPPEVMSRELQAMGKAFSESVEGARRARELVRRWSQDSPASRNACGPDDAEQQVWKKVQDLAPARRKSRACAVVARQREEELAESEEASASVSRGLFVAYMKTTHGAGGSGGGGDAGGVSLQRWLEDRQVAMKKARELEAGRARAQALAKADTEGRKALVSELKEELMRLIGSTKKAQKIDKAPGMEVLRSSREGLDIHRRLKRLDAMAAEEDRARRAAAPPNGGGGGGEGGGGGGKQQPGEARHRHPQQQRQPEATSTTSVSSLLLSKRAFHAEMGNILFSLTADGATAARARELAGIPLIAADLRKKWQVEGGGAGDRGGDRLDASPQKITTKTPPSFEEKGVGVPLAGELFGLEEALLLGRGEKHAEQRKELALQKFHVWSKAKGKEARKAKKLQQAKRAEEAERERLRRAEGLKAYRRWVRLASKESYFSAQNNKVVARTVLSPRLRSSSSSRSSASLKTLSLYGHKSSSSSSSSSNPHPKPASNSKATANTTTGADNGGCGGNRNGNRNGSRGSNGVVCGGGGGGGGGRPWEARGGGQQEQERRSRGHQWNPSTEGADEFYRAAKAGLPDFL
ncbi:unnamed protein product [Pylaiella littoralis]